MGKRKGSVTSESAKKAREAAGKVLSPTVPNTEVPGPAPIAECDHVEPHTVVCPECGARRSMPSTPVRAGASTIWVCHQCGVPWDIRHQFRKVQLEDTAAQAQDLEAENAQLRQEVNELKRWVADMQSGFYVNCVYCGYRFGPAKSTPCSQADLLKEHVESCRLHPLHTATKENIRLKNADLFFVRNRKTRLYSLCITLQEAERLAKANQEQYVRVAHEFPKHEVGVRHA